MNITGIQWCHGTVNPAAGCDGCPLWPALPDLEIKITNVVLDHARAAGRTEVRKRVAELLALHNGPRRITQTESVLRAALDEFAPTLTARGRENARKEIKALFRCYAGTLSHRFAGINPGYPRSFDEPQCYPGRTSEVARLGAPTAKEIVDKPWLRAMRRMIFVSDMGDALSDGITFDYLKQEIVDVAEGEAGSRHMWLWLTKRARRMAEFSDWLHANGSRWPRNVIPMASILNPGYARQAMALLRIPSVVRGYSIEPLNQALELPAPLLSPSSWVIVGGESGVGAKNNPFDLRWARDIRDQCRAAGTPFFMKQLGAVANDGGRPYKTRDTHGGEWEEWPEDLRVREIPGAFRINTGDTVKVEAA